MRPIKKAIRGLAGILGRQEEREPNISSALINTPRWTSAALWVKRGKVEGG